jgi:hypothetical protein
LEVLDPIVLDDEPPTGRPGSAITTMAPGPRDQFERPPPVPDELQAQSSPARVFGLLSILLVLTLMLGVIGGWWINRSIETVRPRSHSTR